jgi:hypothetical protein
MDKLINFQITGYPQMVSDYSIGRRFNSLVDFAVDEVPSTWEDVFQESASSRSGETDEVLHVEIEVMDMPGLLALTKLIAEHPGSRQVVLEVTKLGREIPFTERTSLTQKDELLIRAAVGNAAKIELV